MIHYCTCGQRISQNKPACANCIAANPDRFVKNNNTLTEEEADAVLKTDVGHGKRPKDLLERAFKDLLMNSGMSMIPIGVGHDLYMFIASSSQRDMLKNKLSHIAEEMHANIAEAN